MVRKSNPPQVRTARRGVKQFLTATSINSVVMTHAINGNVEQFASGVVINDGWWLLTCAHGDPPRTIVKPPNLSGPTTQSAKAIRVAGLLAINKKTDVAVYALHEKYPTSVRVLPAGKVAVGDVVQAIGFPGQEFKTQVGRVSQDDVRINGTYYTGPDFSIAGFTSRQGFSGGPVFVQDGNKQFVAGIVSTTLTATNAEAIRDVVGRAGKTKTTLRRCRKCGRLHLNLGVLDPALPSTQTARLDDWKPAFNDLRQRVDALAKEVAKKPAPQPQVSLDPINDQLADHDALIMRLIQRIDALEARKPTAGTNGKDGVAGKDGKPGPAGTVTVILIGPDGKEVKRATDVPSGSTVKLPVTKTVVKE